MDVGYRVPENFVEAGGDFVMLVLAFWGVLVAGQHIDMERQTIAGSKVDSDAQGRHGKPDEAAHTFEVFSWDLFSNLLSSWFLHPSHSCH